MSMCITINEANATVRLIMNPNQDGYEMTKRPNMSKKTGGDSLSPCNPSSPSEVLAKKITAAKMLSPDRWMLPSGIRSVVSASV